MNQPTDKVAFCQGLYGVDGESDDEHQSDDLTSILEKCRKRVNQTPTVTRKSPTSSPCNATSHLGPPNSQREQIKETRHVTPMAKGVSVDNGPQRGRVGTAKTSRVSKKRRVESLEQIPERRQIFRGLVFYFVPNNDISPARRMRISKAAEFGASRATEWRGDITHVIAEKHLSYNDVIKYLGLKSLPLDVTLVNETYLSECITNRAILNASNQRFHLQGTFSALDSNTSLGRTGTSISETFPCKPNSPRQLGECQGTQLETPEGEASDDFLLPCTMSKRGSDGIDEPETEAQECLDTAIREVKAAAILPLDPSDEEDDLASSSSFSGVSEDSSSATKTRKQFKRPKIRKGNSSWQQSFACMQKSDGTQHGNCPNSRTVDILQQMLGYYERVADPWRSLAYRRGISAIRREKEPITTKEQALAIPGIGERLAAKIEEIVWTNRLRQLEQTNLEPKDILLSTFLGVYGAGFQQASKWIAKGYKSLEDLKNRAPLTENQRIGIEHYNDFQQRIPRTEVQKHGNIVREAVLKVDGEYQVIVGGSYRRGASDSGDIDLIISKQGASLEQINGLVMDRIIPDLFERGYLKASLAVSSRVGGSKWHGASALPGSSTWRRIDLLFVPGEEIGAALIYFTGNDVFNRSLRLLASKKGMCLNQKGLFSDILRRPDRVKLNSGHLLESKDEKRIFELLGVPWRPPSHRIC